MEHTIRVLDPTAGDVVTRYQTTDAKSVSVAKQTFIDAKAKGFIALDAEADTVIKEFDPEVETIVMTPMVRGG